MPRTTNPLAEKLTAIVGAAKKQGYSDEQARQMVADELSKHSAGDAVLAEAALAKALNR